jgi:hypothetical protein
MVRAFRYPIAAVLTAYAVTYGGFAIFFYHGLATHQRPEDHPKFAPSSAFIWAALYATAAFAAIAIIWLIGAMIWATVSASARFLKQRKSRRHREATQIT